MTFRKMIPLSFILFLVSCGVSMMPSKDAWYTQHYVIMQDFEREAYKDFSPAARLEFQKLFWEARSPESKKEFDKRMASVAKAFKKENAHQPWNTDRGRIYLLNGDPIQVDHRQNVDWSMKVQEGGAKGVAESDDRSGEDVGANTAEIWTYRYDKYLVNYVFAFKSPNEWRLAQTSFEGNRYYGALETQSKELTYTILEPEQYKQKLEALKSIK
jgi:GWxTD domain-containing protein